MKVQLLKRYIERVDGRTFTYLPGEIIDIAHGEILIERGKAIAVQSESTQLSEAPAGRRGRPKGK